MRALRIETHHDEPGTLTVLENALLQNAKYGIYEGETYRVEWHGDGEITVRLRGGATWCYLNVEDP
jgi:hypothetical protein